MKATQHPRNYIINKAMVESYEKSRRIDPGFTPEHWYWEQIAQLLSTIKLQSNMIELLKQKLDTPSPAL